MIPVIYIHTGSIPEYLVVSLTQAARMNREVILLTDIPFSHPGVTVKDISVYGAQMAAFRKVYRHMSSNEPEFEIICIARWLVLSEFMLKENIKACFYADSDVMIYSDVSEIYAGFGSFDAAYTMTETQHNLRWSASACCSFWTCEGIRRFAEFIFKMYEPDGIARLGKKWKYHQENGMAGGVCDMTLLYLFAETVNFRNLSIVSNGIAFDQNMLAAENFHPDEYRMVRRKGENRFQKKIFWRNGLPYGLNMVSGEKVRLAALTEYAKLILQEKSAVDVAKFHIKKILGRA